MSRTRKSSIILKILLPIMGLVLVGNIISYLVIANSLDKSSHRQINLDLSHVIGAVSESIYMANEREKTILETLANIPQIKSDEVSLYEKSQLIFKYLSVNKGKYIDMCILDTQGNAYINGSRKMMSFAEREYFQEAMKGKFYIQNPFINKVTNTMAIFYSIPVYNMEGEIINVVFSVVDGYKYCELLKEYTVGKSSKPMIFDRETGVMIGSTDIELFNTLPHLADMDGFSSIEKQIESFAEETGDDESDHIESIRFGSSKEEYLAAYNPIRDTSWSVVVAAPISDFSKEYYAMQNKVLAVYLSVLLITIIVSALILLRILRPLKNVKDSIKSIASGDADLTKRLEVQSHDEVGNVVVGFNTFVEMLSNIIVSVKESKNELSQNGEKMESVTGETIDSIGQIISQLDEVKEKLERQVSCVDQTIHGVAGVSQKIESMDSLMKNQVSGVKEATSSVNRMIVNIKNVGVKVESMTASFEGILKETQEGSNMQENVNHLIKDIETQSETLREANKVIAEIAEQTNLLAMNAAIEAAHAGESGKGFSVVADEIRKLSETSTSQSKTIGEQLAAIQNLISQVVQASENTIKVFNSVIGNIGQTNVAVLEIKSSLDQQQENSKQIERSLEMLDSTTKSMYEENVVMQSQNEDIHREIKELEETTEGMKAGFEKMGQKAVSVKENSDSLTNISADMKQYIGKIGKQIDLFKV